MIRTSSNQHLILFGLVESRTLDFQVLFATNHHFQCLFACRQKKFNTVLLVQKAQRILNGLPIELFNKSIYLYQTHLMMPNDSELNWHNRSQLHLKQICVHYRQCWEPSLQRRQQLCCTQPPQCSVGLFCVAAAGVAPKIKGQRDTSPVQLQVSHRPNKVLLMQFFRQMWTGIDVSYMVNRIHLKVC